MSWSARPPAGTRRRSSWRSPHRSYGTPGTSTPASSGLVPRGSHPGSLSHRSSTRGTANERIDVIHESLPARGTVRLSNGLPVGLLVVGFDFVLGLDGAPSSVERATYASSAEAPRSCRIPLR